ncbi:MAG: hypothetical protein AAB638_00840 [Patescibacteria group bacterium]
MANQPEISMPHVDIHYFDKEEGTRIISFTIVVMNNMVLKSGRPEMGYTLTEVITNSEKKGFNHRKL